MLAKHKSIVLTLKFISIGPKVSVSNKLRLFPIDIDEIFPMQLSEFTKSMYFRSNLYKTLEQNLIFFLPIKMDFY